MLTRILTSVVGIPVVILIMLLGTPYVEIAGLVIAMIGLYEFYQMVSQKYHPIPLIGYIATLIYFSGLTYFESHFLMYLTVLVLVLLMIMVFYYPKYRIADIAITAIAPIYVSVFIGFTMLVRAMPEGEWLVWLIFISAWGSDTCAYFAGRWFGKNKLAPVLSPKKTIEGSVGGAIGATLIAMCYLFVYTSVTQPVDGVLSILLGGSIVFFAALLSQVGDLAASAIKRDMEAKDFGHLFPGHGGVLDRFDSILFVAPFIYFALNLLN